MARHDFLGVNVHVCLTMVDEILESSYDSLKINLLTAAIGYFKYRILLLLSDPI